MKANMMSTPDAQAPKRIKRARANGKKAGGPPRHAARSAAAKARESGDACSRCDHRHVLDSGKPSCNGHRRGSDPLIPCLKPPLRGAAVCRLHGANGLVRANAEKRITWENTEGEVAALLRECDLPEQHPIDGLLEVVRHTGAMMRLLGFLVSELDLAPGITVHKTEDGVVKVASDDAIWGLNHNEDQASHVLVGLYGQWSDRYARACKLALDANIDERMVRNAEATTQVMYNAVSKALENANLTPDQAALFGKTLATELRKVVGPLDALPRRTA